MTDCLFWHMHGVQFQARLERLVQEAAEHPKMAALLRLLLQHFDGARPGADEAASARSGAAGDPSRVIIFTNLRETVVSICEALRPHEPLIRAKCARLNTPLTPLEGLTRVPACPLLSCPNRRGLQGR
jgi:hypothetical protein